MNRAAAAIFLVLVLSGCPKRIDFGPAGRITDAEELLRLTRAGQEQAVSVQGEGKLRVESPQGSGSVSVYLAASHPALLHLEMFDFFNRPVAVLVTDGERFGLHQLQENRYYVGLATPENLSSFLPVVLPSQELVAALLGRPPFLPAERMALQLNEDEGLYVLTLQREEVTQVLHIHPTHHRVVRSEVRGRRAYELAYDGFQKREGLTFPHEVTLSATHSGNLVRMRYTDITLNGTPELTLFELTPPEDVPVIEVDAHGQQPPPVEFPPTSPEG